LTWGDNPRDLDAHLVGPNADGSSFEIYYGSRENENANLDVDDTSSYGPEIITLKTLHPGTYKYFVYHFSGSGTLSTSEAVVNLSVNEGAISGTGATRSFSVPQGEGKFWNVFNINVDAQGHATLEEVNAITTSFVRGSNMK
jgi:hypothetical protein